MTEALEIYSALDSLHKNLMTATARNQLTDHDRSEIVKIIADGGVDAAQRELSRRIKATKADVSGLRSRTRMHKHTHTHMRTHLPTHVKAPMCAHTQSHTYVRTRTCTYIPNTGSKSAIKYW